MTPKKHISIDSEDIKDIELQFKISNNQLKQRRKALGLNRAQLCRMLKISAVEYGKLENLKADPKRKDGDWRQIVYVISDFYFAAPEDLFPPITRNVKTNKASVTLNENDALLLMGEQNSAPALPDECLISKETQENIEKVLKTLTPREESVVRKRYGLNNKRTGMTLDEIGAEFYLSRERIRGIEAKALRKLRHPSRAKYLQSRTSPLTSLLNTILGALPNDIKSTVKSQNIPINKIGKSYEEKYILDCEKLYKNGPPKRYSVRHLAIWINNAINEDSRFESSINPYENLIIEILNHD